MRVKRLARVPVLLFLAVILTACGGGGGKTSSGGSNPVAVTGVFVDSVVQGLDYGTATQSGITNANGEFSYVPSESVTFAIGGIVLGRGLGLPVLTPVDLVLQAADETHPVVMTIARLLLTLDDDQIPDNGITIASSLRTAALTFNVDLQQDITSETQLQDLVDQLTTAVTGGSGTVGTASRTLVSTQFAQDHLHNSLLALDQTPPDVTITSAPADPANSSDATFEFSSSEIATTFTCKLDDGPLTPCTSPQDYASLTLGAHSFLVRAMDPSGNTADATWEWTVDLSLDVTISNGPDGPTNDPSPSFAFSANLPATYTCALDGAPLAACTSPQDYQNLADGPHTFQVEAAADSSGVTADATRTFTVDTILPDVTITSGPADPTTASTATFDFSSGDPTAVFSCALDPAGAGDFTDCTSPVTYQELFHGDHVFQVIATDPAGNSFPAPYPWTVNDVTPPDTASVVIEGGAATTESATVNLTLAARDTGSGVNGYCVLDNATGIAPASPSAGDGCFNPVTAAIDYSETLPYTFAGSYIPGVPPGGNLITLYVWYRDDSGNVTAAPAVAAIGLVDETLPTVDTLIIDPPVAPDDALPNSKAATYELLADRVTINLEVSDNIGVPTYFVSEQLDPNNLVVPSDGQITLVPASSGPTIIEYTLLNTYLPGDTVEICAWAKDSVGQRSSAKCDTITYGVDWESGIGSWTRDVNPTVWLVGSFGVSEPFGACFNGSDTCAGTGLSTDFAPANPPDSSTGTPSRLMSPTIVLPTVAGGATLHLRFQNAYEYEIPEGPPGATGYGQVQIQVYNETSSDFDPPQDVGPAVTGVSSDWEIRDVDLTAYAGQKVRLVFLHVALDQTGQIPGPTFRTSAGWFIDDVQIVIQP